MRPEIIARLRAAQGGDREALRALLEDSGGIVVAAIRAQVGRCDELEDLVQETLLRACEKLDRLRQPERFDSWLYGMGRRVALEWCRQRRRRPRALPLSQEPESRPAASERLARLDAALALVPARYRETLALYYGEARSYEDIAGLLGITRAAVNQRLTRARALLKGLLERR